MRPKESPRYYTNNFEHLGIAWCCRIIPGSYKRSLSSHEIRLAFAAMKIAIIGSNRGIGLALTKHYSKDHEVYAFCRSKSPELSELSTNKNLKVLDGCDVNSFASLQDTAKKCSGVNFDIFIHVAGIWRTENFDSLNEQTIMEQLHTNALAPILCVKAFENSLGLGSKVGLVTSRMGSIADNDSGGRYGYRMSKAALNAGGKSLSIDLKDQGVAVFLLHPGFVQTDMTEGHGNLTTKESASGIAKIFEQHDISQSGSFFHVNGEELPW